MEWQLASELQVRVGDIISGLNLTHINPKRVFVFRSFGSRSRARARIWSLPRIWQQALKTRPGYCLEVLAEKFDNLSHDNQQRILIHELLHIPKNFSGALLPHRRRGIIVGPRIVEQWFKKLKKHDRLSR